jgi:hypothetical protein
MVERGGIHVSGGVSLPVRRLQTSKGVGLHSQRQRRAEGRQAIPRFITARRCGAHSGVSFLVNSLPPSLPHPPSLSVSIFCLAMALARKGAEFKTFSATPSTGGDRVGRGKGGEGLPLDKFVTKLARPLP